MIGLKELLKEVVVESSELGDVKKLNIDETSRKKGHDYVTNFLDAETGKLLDIQRGKGAKVIERFVKKGLSKGLNPSLITDISIDMSPSFICGCETYFKQAAISFDKFHVSQLINRCFDEFRKKQARLLGERLPKWSIVKPIEKLNVKEQQELDELLSLLPQLEQFHNHKNKFSELWEYENPEQGAAFLAFWIGRVEEMGQQFKNKKMLTLAQTLTKHFDRIINVLKSGMDNAISEAFNNNVQIMKRVARGYKKFEYYIQMIKVHCDLVT
ncbi:MAG: transposase [Bacteroidota bacterium]